MCAMESRARIIIEAVTQEAGKDLQRVGQELQKISGAGENAGRVAAELATQYRAMGRAATAAAIDAAAVGDKKHAADLAKQAAEANKLATQYDKLAASSQRSGKTIGQTLGEIRTATVIAMAAVVGAVRLADKAYDASVGELMRLASEVRKLSTITGQSAEDTSRLVQVFADFNIESSQVTAAMRIMRSQGLVPTMASIAQLSDRYLALAPGIERVNFLQTTFGRGGAEFALVLEQGSAALRARADTVESGLVLTQAQLDQTEELRQAQDDLSDAGKSLALVVGSALVPAVLAFTKTAINAITPARDLNRQWQLTNRSLAESTPNYRDYVRAVRDAAEANRISAQAGREFYVQSVQNGTLTEDQARALGILTEAQWQELRAEQALGDDRREGILALRQIRLAIDDVTTAEERLAAMQDEAAASMQGLADNAAAMWGGAESSIDSFITASIAAIDFMLTQGPEWMAAGEAIRDAVMANVITPEQGRAYFQEMEIARQAMMTELSSPEEWAAARAVATEWGIPFYRALAAIQQARIEAENFPRNLQTIIQIAAQVSWFGVEHGIGGGGGGGGAAVVTKGRQHGGPLGRGWTLVGEAGQELITPNRTVIPHAETQRLLQSGLMPERRAQGGGDFGLRPAASYARRTQAWVRHPIIHAAVTQAYQAYQQNPALFGGGLIGGAGASAGTAAATAAAVAEATAPIAEAVGALVAAMPSAEQISQSSTAAAQSQAAAIVASNRELAAILTAILMGQGRLATDGGVARATRDAWQAGG